ncbi:hypothetical protein KM043_004192 [Ampulex compressa]|nr:hypothetical protein KM043_004192 [Ampulex compressa]
MPDTKFLLCPGDSQAALVAASFLPASLITCLLGKANGGSAASPAGLILADRLRPAASSRGFTCRRRFLRKERQVSLLECREPAGDRGGRQEVCLVGSGKKATGP